MSRQKFVSICCATLAAAAFALPDRAAASGDSGGPPQSDLTARHSLGSILYVPSQYPTIQAALDAASDGDEIRVANGTYTGPGNYDLKTTCYRRALLLRQAAADWHALIRAIPRCATASSIGATLPSRVPAYCVIPAATRCSPDAQSSGVSSATTQREVTVAADWPA